MLHKKQNESDMNVHDLANKAASVINAQIARPFDRAKKGEDRQHGGNDGGSRAERQPPGQANNSDRVSDNDSNASSTGVQTIKRNANPKNTAQKPSKPWKVKKTVFDIDTNPILQKHFDQVGTDKRLRNVQQLR